MARDYLSIGPVPCDEDCQQVGMPSYDGVQARKECAAFIRQLRRQFGDEPEGARLAVKSFPHDFGTYMEVVCYFDDGCAEAVDYAFRCEGDAWNEWDTVAREELGIVDDYRKTSYCGNCGGELCLDYCINCQK